MDQMDGILLPSIPFLLTFLTLEIFSNLPTNKKELQDYIPDDTRSVRAFLLFAERSLLIYQQKQYYFRDQAFRAFLLNFFLNFFLACLHRYRTNLENVQHGESPKKPNTTPESSTPKCFAHIRGNEHTQQPEYIHRNTHRKTYINILYVRREEDREREIASKSARD